jgi:hypothetical protein
MAGSSLRDRFFTPRVARALTSPSGILAIGAGTAAGILAGLGPVGAVVLGAGAYAVRIGAAMGLGSGDRPERIDPFTLQEPWRGFVQDALSSRARFREAVDRTRSGPLKDTLHEIADRVDTGVDECWLIANRGHSLVQTRLRIDTASIDQDLAEVDQSLATRSDDARLTSTAESLRAQRATAERMDQVIEEARSQLRLLDARMGEAVVRALELSAQASSDASVTSLESDVDGMVTDMEALRQALEETHGTPGTSGGLQQGPTPG